MDKLSELLKELVARGGSDLHIAPGNPPMLRMQGDLMQISTVPIAPEVTREMLVGILEDWQAQDLETKRNIDFAYQVSFDRNVYRFRVNIYHELRGVGANFRKIGDRIPTLNELGLPESLLQLTNHHHGLVLITGPASCGKTTTLSSLVNFVNESKPCHIITIEEPVEYIYSNSKAIVHQRQVGLHTDSFETALKSALREDPDVIVVGELRGLESVRWAITAAETGHLVFGTLHTSNPSVTINRLIDAFPSPQRPQIRNMLAESLLGIVTQYLLISKDFKRRYPAIEVLTNTAAVATTIRESKTYLIPNVMQTGKNQGMVLLEDSLQDLLKEQRINKEDAESLLTEQKFLFQVFEKKEGKA